jgi:Fe-S-cluster containining protein
MKKPFPIPVKVRYSCEKCPGWCCTYDEIEVNKRDIERLARHFGLDAETAAERFTKVKGGTPMLRHKKDSVFDTACMFLDQDKRRCTIYEARPTVCRQYPNGNRCGYYEFLKFEREQQGDDEIVAMT